MGVWNTIGSFLGLSSDHDTHLQQLRNTFKRYPHIYDQIEDVYKKHNQDIDKTRLELKRMVAQQSQPIPNGHGKQHQDPVRLQSSYVQQGTSVPTKQAERVGKDESISKPHDLVLSGDTTQKQVFISRLHLAFPHVPMNEILRIYDKNRGNYDKAEAELAIWRKPQGTNKLKPLTKRQKEQLALLRQDFPQIQQDEVQNVFRQTNFDVKLSVTLLTERKKTIQQFQRTTQPSRPLTSPHHAQQPIKHEEEAYWGLMHEEPAEPPVTPVSEVPLNVLVELRSDLVKAMNSIPVNSQLNGDEQKARRELLEEFNHHLNELRTVYNSRISSVIDVSNCSPEEFVSLISSLAKTPKQIAIEFFFGDQTPQQFAEILHHKEINHCINGFSNSLVVQF
ncbi:hypothetical protein P9112_007071 [Eukaryota sp. TZLM1-RC]